MGTISDAPVKTLILDLDETLVHTWADPAFVEEYKIYSTPDLYYKFHPIGEPAVAYSFTIDGTPCWGLYRPYLYEFLAFASEYFDNVLIWSAGIREYVYEIVRRIFVDTGITCPRLILSRDQCATYNGTYHKPISVVTTMLESRYYETFTIDPDNTLVVDDREYTFMANPDNGILIPPFAPEPTLEGLLDRSDDALYKLQRWLDNPRVRNSTNLAALKKDEIFSRSLKS